MNKATIKKLIGEATKTILDELNNAKKELKRSSRCYWNKFINETWRSQQNIESLGKRERRHQTEIRANRER